MSHEQTLITCDAESEGVALEELRQIYPTLSHENWLDTGDAIEGSIMLVQLEIPFEAFAKQIDCASPIFIRHLAPVQQAVALSGTSADVTLLTNTAMELAGRLRPDRTFAVQTRILCEGKLPYRKVTINECISEALEAETGIAMDCRQPGQVVSVLCTATTGYIGISPVELNRSEWPGGKHRFKRDDGLISRAEFKLLEACNVFKLTLPQDGKALDMGAAPGGWSRILAKSGLHVYAVDPADLDARLHNISGIEHIRSRIQDYLSRAGQFEVIVNDMKMDARTSAKIMLDARRHLTPGGIAIVTLKLPKLPGSTKMSRKLLGMVKEDLHRLSETYTVYGARQLYHNRSEVTVILQG